LVKIYAKEGDSIEAGKVIAEIDSGD